MGTFLCHFWVLYFTINTLFPVKKGIVSDNDIRERMKGIPDERGVVRRVSGCEKNGSGEITLTDMERRFLEDIARHPVSGVVARYERLRINRYQGNKIQKSLLGKGLISWRPVSTRTGRLKVLVLTDKGKKAIPDVKVEKVFRGNASWEHEYWKFRVGEYYRKKGYEVTYEYKLPGGKSVDVVAEKGGKRIAVEIETGKSDAVYNVRKDLEAGFDEVNVFHLFSGKIELIPKRTVEFNSTE